VSPGEVGTALGPVVKGNGLRFFAGIPGSVPLSAVINIREVGMSTWIFLGLAKAADTPPQFLLPDPTKLYEVQYATTTIGSDYTGVDRMDVL
jgi:hypothetical protein